MVNITIRVLSRPSVNSLATIYKELGQDYDERVLPSIVNEVLKGVVAQFNASQLISALHIFIVLSLRAQMLSNGLVAAQREMVSRLVRDNLSRRANRFNIILDDVSLTHVTFSPVFAESVEAKQIAQQTAQRAAYLVDQAYASLPTLCILDGTPDSCACEAFKKSKQPS